MSCTIEPLLDVEADKVSILNFLDLVCHPLKKPARNRSGVPNPIPMPSAMIVVCGKAVEHAMTGVAAAVESTSEGVIVLVVTAKMVRVGGTSVRTDGVGRRTVVKGADIFDVM